MAIIKHLYDSICSTDSVVSIIERLWDQAKDDPDRGLIFVLETAAEVAMMHHELTAVRESAVPIQEADKVDPDQFEPDKFKWEDAQGQVLVLTYRQLGSILQEQRRQPIPSIRLIAHMGCGEYTVEMLATCLQLVRWAGESMEIYTVSNLEQSVFLGAESIRLDALGIDMRRRPERRWLSGDRLQSAINTLGEQAALFFQAKREEAESQARAEGDAAEQLSGAHSNRAVVVMDKLALDEALASDAALQESKAYLEAIGLGAIDGEELLTHIYYDEHHMKLLQLGQGMGFTGTVSRIGTVLVWPLKSGIIFDTRTSQMVWRKNILLSKAELRYAARFSDGPDLPEIMYFLEDKSWYDQLPELTRTSPAFTGDLSTLLLELCRQGYLDSTLELPIGTPDDQNMVREYLYRLKMKGLIADVKRPPGTYRLTSLGDKAAWWYHDGGVGNLNVACLLAAVSGSISDNMAPRDKARAAAVMRLAAVLMTPGSPLTSPIGDLLTVLTNNDSPMEPFREDLSTYVSGFAAPYALRGPIWAAVGIWSALAGKMDIFGLTPDKDPNLTACQELLSIRLHTMVAIIENFKSLQSAWVDKLRGPSLEFEPQLTREDVLLVEKALVRAWMHNLAFVPVSMHQDGTQMAFAYDVVSGCPIRRQDKDFVFWGHLQNTEDGAPLDNSEDFAGVCAIYTHLQQDVEPGDGGGFRYTPDNLTFVSMRAVRQVLRDVARPLYRADPGQKPLNWQQILRTQYRLHQER